jgi:hypothetical protein
MCVGMCVCERENLGLCLAEQTTRRLRVVQHWGGGRGGELIAHQYYLSNNKHYTSYYITFRLVQSPVDVRITWRGSRNVPQTGGLWLAPMENYSCRHGISGTTTTTIAATTTPTYAGSNNNNNSNNNTDIRRQQQQQRQQQNTPTTPARIILSRLEYERSSSSRSANV